MDLITLRDRIRINALTANLTYTEIETLFDVNELNNQAFPCFTWAYRGESGGEDSSSVISCDIYLMDTYPDSVKIETENYQRDYIITRQDALRQYFFDWLPLMNLDSDDYIEMDKYAEVPIAEKIGVNGFIAISYRVGFRIKRPFCFNEGAITPPSQVDVYFNGGLEYEQASNVDLNLTLKNQLGVDIDATFTGYDIVVNQTCADANVENSDSSYTESVPSGDTLVLPNEAITINSSAFITKPSVKDQDILLKDVAGNTITPVSLTSDTITILNAVICANANVENSDGTYTEPIASGATLVLPNIAVTVNGGAFLNIPSVQDVALTLVNQDFDTVIPTFDGNEIIVDTGYQRPSEWIAMPAALSKTLYGLVLVFENDVLGNRFEVSSSLAGIGHGYFDFENNGTQVAFTGALQTYNYNYATMGGAVSVYTLDGSNRNYKQAIFKMHQATINENIINLNPSYPKTQNAIVDMVIHPDGNGFRLYFADLLYLKIINLVSYSNIAGRTLYTTGRVIIEKFTSPNNDVNLDNGLGNLTLKTVLRDITGNLTSFKCDGARNIIASKMISAEIGFCNNLTITAGTDIAWLAKININGTVICTNSEFRRMFNSCTTRKLIFSSIPPQPTSMLSSGGCFGNMVNLEELIVPNLQNGFGISNSRMNETALNAMFTSLGTANGAQTITITGNSGAATCNTAIATAKGFTVII